MRIAGCILLCLCFIVTPVSALEIQAPRAPEEGLLWMPEETDSFERGLKELLQNVLDGVYPELRKAGATASALVAAVLLLSVLEKTTGSVRQAARIAGSAAIGLLLLDQSAGMIRLATDTVTGISEYAKLLLPVMTAALAAQGGITSSAALYAGTAAFNAVLTALISHFLVPGIWVYLAVCICRSALGEELLKKMGELLKGLMTWLLKILLMVFTTYLGITGVVSGTTDAAALKAAKVTISTVVPVVGGVLSDASEAVLVSAGLMKNAAGIYGILAVLAVFLYPFVRIGIHYLILKLTATVCSVFGGKEITGLIVDFSGAMGLLLAMTGTSCLMILISTVCFLRGVG